MTRSRTRTSMLACLLGLAGCEGFGHVIVVDAGDDASADAAVDAPDDALDPVDALDIDAPPLAPIPLGLIVMFDGACPSGFTERADLANLYLRGHDGDATLGETGGAATHTHQVAGHTHDTGLAGAAHTHAITFDASSQTTIATPGGTLSGSGPAHTHSATSSTAGGPHAHGTTASSGVFATATATNDPLFREVVLCEVSGTPTLLPTTAIALSASTCAATWTSIANTAGRLLRGHDLDGDIAEVGGAATHAHAMNHTNGTVTAGGGEHTHTATAGAASIVLDDLVASGTATAANGSHAHAITMSGGHNHSVPAFTGSTAVAPTMPSYRELMTCRPSTPSPLPVDALAITTSSCPTGWIEVVEFRNRFLGGDDGSATQNEILGGAHTHDATHTHGSTGMSAHTHTSITGGASTGTVTMRDSNSRLVSAAGHTHTISVGGADGHAHPLTTASPTVTDVEAIPLYVEVVVCRRE
jgi:hypothetical protein